MSIEIGSNHAFDPEKPAWALEYAQLKELLTPEEYAAARSSTLNAHYTSPTVIQAIYEAVDRMGFETGNILEPSMGVGNFFGMLPEKMRNSRLYGVELDPVSGRIAKQLYPKADITVGRNNINLKLNHQLFKNRKLETNATYRTRTIDGAGTSGTNIVTALRFRPTNGLSAGVAVDPDDDEENLDGDGNSLNQKYTPVEENKQNYRKRDEQALSLKAALVWDVIKGLQFRSEYGISTTHANDNQFYGPLSSTASAAGMNNMPSAKRTKTHKESYRLANTLTYRNSFNKSHNVNVMLGQEINHAQNDNTFMSAKLFPVSVTAEAALENFALGTPNQSTSYKSAPDRTASFFGRALYDYKNRYYATLTVRADGSTKFAPGKQWGYFPAGSIAWRISNEKWMKPIRFISDLKLSPPRNGRNSPNGSAPSSNGSSGWSLRC